MTTLQTMLSNVQEADNTAKTVEIRDSGVTTSDHKNTIGWFANSQNRATGWIVTELDDYDKSWLLEKAVKNVDKVKRTYSVHLDTTSLVRFNLSTGTYAFLDNEYLEKHDEIKFERMTKFSIFMLDDIEYKF